jgi:3-methyl-2-oxobutanoate hydroxymethyltransferase
MRFTISKIQDMKRAGDKITMLTAYDYSTARIVDEAGVPLILVGDTLGMVMLGYETTVPVTMEEMLHHAKAVVRGTRQSLIIGDMPFMTYQVSAADAMRNAARFMQEAGCQAVKHIGLTPQSIHQLSGHRVQGKTAEAARRLLNDAIALEQAGAFAVVLELVPAPLAKIITARLKIPTIGIGAGPDCDGQVQVIHDMLGLFTDFVPKHAKQYAKLAGVIKSAISEYINETKSGVFPTSAHGSTMDGDLLKDL